MMSGVLPFPIGLWGKKPKSIAIEVTVPASKIAGNLDDGFLFWFDLAHVDLSNPIYQPFWDALLSNGGNIRVFADGNYYPRMIRNINKTSKTGQVWFKVPHIISGGLPFSFLLVADVDLTDDFQVTDPEGQYAALADFELLVDLEDGNITNPEELTGNATGSNTINGTAMSPIVGKMNSGYHYYGSSAHRWFGIAHVRTGDAFLSTWFRKNGIRAGGMTGLLMVTHHGYANYGFYMSSAGTVQSRLHPKTSAPQNKTIVSSTVLSDGNWHHLVSIVDRNDRHKLFVDGVLEAEVDMTDVIGYNYNSPINFTVNTRYHHRVSLPFRGEITNIMYARQLFSDNAAITQYQNQNDPESFFQIGNLVTL